MDITETLTPKSDQLDAVDLAVSGPRVFTVKGARRGNADQPVQVDLEEFDRPWRPGKSMRRILAACWGPIASEWVGKKLELFCDSEVVYGGEKVGGVRIRAMSHIDGPQQVPLIIKRGRSAIYQVAVLKPTPAAPHLPSREEVAACDDLPQLQAWCAASTGQRKAAIEARIAELMGADDDTPEPEPTTGAEEQGELMADA